MRPHFRVEVTLVPETQIETRNYLVVASKNAAETAQSTSKIMNMLFLSMEQHTKAHANIKRRRRAVFSVFLAPTARLFDSSVHMTGPTFKSLLHSISYRCNTMEKNVASYFVHNFAFSL